MMRLTLRHIQRAGFSRRRVLLIFIFSSFFSLIFFQNCGAPMQSVGNSLSSSSDSATMSAKFSTIPFAYNVSVDHLAYMSCTNGSANRESYFTFKVGAYDASNGIGLTQDFLSATQNMSISQKIDALSYGEANANIQPQFALRNRVNLSPICRDRNQNGSTDSAVECIEGEDYDNFLAPLNSEAILQETVSLGAGQKVNYFSFAEGLGGRTFESSISFMGGEGLANDVRLSMNNNAVLALSFFDSQSQSQYDTQIFRPSGDTANPAGLSFRLGFSIGHGVTNAGYGVSERASFSSAPSKVLSSVNEVNLLTNQSQGQWVCPQKLRFMIVRPEDNGRSFNCGLDSSGNPNFYENVKSIPEGLSSNEAQLYVVARNVLPIEYWHLDFQKGCAVPKAETDQCYGSVSDQHPINYYASTYYGVSGGASFQFSSQCGDGDSNGSTCPNYISICYRQ